MARRFLLLALLLLGGMGSAWATCTNSTNTFTNTTCSTVPEASAKASAILSTSVPCSTYKCGTNYAPYNSRVIAPTASPWTAWQVCRWTISSNAGTCVSVTASAQCPAGQTLNTTTWTCSVPCPTTAPALGDGWIEGDITSLTGPTGTCSGSCMFYPPPGYTSATLLTIDGVTYTNVKGFVAAGTTCTAGGSTPGSTSPPSDGDGDGVSDGSDSAPDNPGSGDIPPDAPPPDPDCGTAGHPNCPTGPDGENKSSGGGDCKTPPSSSGDAIGAQIAFQTWATRCAIEGKANQTGGDSGASGDGTDMTATNAKLDGISGLIQSVKDFFGGESTGDEHGDPDSLDKVSGENAGPDVGDVDQSGWVGDSGLPPFPAINLPVLGPIFDGTPPAFWVQLIAWFKAMNLLFASFYVARVLAGAKE